MDVNYINLVHLGEYVGTILKNALNTLDLLETRTWIIDTWASNHMCIDLNLINHPTILIKLAPMYLLDRLIKTIHHVGNVTLHPKIVPSETLHVSSFKFNLLYVQKLAKTTHIIFIFSCTYYVLQDLKTEEVLSIGKVIGSLYILDQSYFSFVKWFAIPSYINTYYINKTSISFEFL